MFTSSYPTLKWNPWSPFFKSLLQFYVICWQLYVHLVCSFWNGQQTLYKNKNNYYHSRSSLCSTFLFYRVLKPLEHEIFSNRTIDFFCTCFLPFFIYIKLHFKVGFRVILKLNTPKLEKHWIKGCVSFWNWRCLKREHIFRQIMCLLLVHQTNRSFVMF